MTNNIIAALLSKEVLIPLLLFTVAGVAHLISLPVREKNIISFKRFNKRLDIYDVLNLDLSNEIERLHQDVDASILEAGEYLNNDYEFANAHAERLHSEVLEEIVYLTNFLEEGPSERTHASMSATVDMLSNELEKLEGFVADPSSYMRPLQCLVNGEVKV